MRAVRSQIRHLATGTTHFGYKNVPTEDKAKLVGSVFSQVAKNYDYMNDAMSCGVHRLWKNHFIDKLDPGQRYAGKPLNYLDIAAGSGDIALRILNHSARKYGDNESNITISDINREMLAEGAKRFEHTRYRQGTPQGDRVKFLVQNAETLESIPDNSQDMYTVSFGIRNFTDIPKALKTAHRVLKPGGVFACLEFSKVELPVIKQVYSAYSFNVIPLLGQVLVGDHDSYQYLVESIEKFPTQDEFANMIREAGFATVGSGYENLTFGVAAIHTGIKLA
ncbi:2-hexaprenyl-6-methoxy-1,4-benzoquinone methyltransferase [Starmerella bacillaris]|uniref:2-methoxy-6-polyprenyl-1,4-benzoquinol methylase, mitochondrial n=1 Tax=Starmerella bacillaris TaxID=1247836 RepID=A0AAV5RGM5_STABA|nr:2-hexaprenyl-6-methoxy-1,4-benzoquinone methyltransferase [Starmerella bacillaris]